MVINHLTRLPVTYWPILKYTDYFDDIDLIEESSYIFYYLQKNSYSSS